MASDTSNNNNGGNNSIEDFSVPCIPDNEDIEPPIEQLESFYVMLENGNIPELQWKCPGRRPISPVTSKEEPKVQKNVEKETPVSKTDFDFMDDISLPQMRVRSQNSTPKGSAKKKTANFAGVIDALKKHRLSQSKEGSGGGGGGGS